ncbi:MAG: bifunctional 5,10-methylenetetrahydrofolate dehydrogenase/5,10-methenyltetrahydrofolate cyclohydrolase [Lachnospiraceae bacterium]|jgi:methylenetetrahydrofolate dehydrogenase (NADP+)/methenyltetrahydrofolate cyclohydrolase|nr:bifunctional 5,10-methylenetetrahydrofolate dehydrogenase/5,10-methenyltetrahydrofolate cyclohydrolase [Lachnospiraceae bacterium]
MILLKGAAVSARLKEEVQGLLDGLPDGGHVPTAAIVRVGERPDDISYERNVIKRIAAFGMEARSYVFPADISAAEFVREFEKINEDEGIDGILLFRPLPAHMDGRLFERLIRPQKDLDGISPVNAAKVFAGETDGFAPCTAEAVIEVLKAYGIQIEGKRAVIVGRSMVVGRPLAMLLLRENATVTVCHTKTHDLKKVCREAEILVAAAGRAGMLTKEETAEGAVVMDVGINVDQSGKLCGDMVWDGLETVAAAATPVPGGVGAVTTAVLAKHLAQAAWRSRQTEGASGQEA